MKRLHFLLTEVLWPRKLICLCCAENSGGEFLCADCARELDALRIDPADRFVDGACSIWRYSGCVSRLIISLKLKCLADAAHVLADGMAEAVSDLCLPADTVLTWVSMPQRRLRVRGIDHGRILCEAVAQRCGLPARQLLRRTKRVHTQRGLNRAQRMSNLAGSIEAIGPLNRPVLLIDDVLTTGATASVCTQALKRAGATDVYVLTAARVSV